MQMVELKTYMREKASSSMILLVNSYISSYTSSTADSIMELLTLFFSLIDETE